MFHSVEWKKVEIKIIYNYELSRDVEQWQYEKKENQRWKMLETKLFESATWHQQNNDKLFQSGTENSLII